MRTRVPSAALFSIVLVLLVGLLAGCGGSQSGGGGSSQDGGEQNEEQGGGDSQGRSEKKIALGSIDSVKPDSRKVVLAPEFEEQGSEELTFNVRKNAQIRVNDEEAELSDIQKGQSAQVEYVTKNEVNRAVAVEIVGGE